LVKELWAFTSNRIAVRFAYEWRDGSGQCYRSYGNENWAFSTEGLMRRRIGSIQVLAISESAEKLTWGGCIGANDFPSLSTLGL